MKFLSIRIELLTDRPNAAMINVMKRNSKPNQSYSPVESSLTRRELPLKSVSASAVAATVGAAFPEAFASSTRRLHPLDPERVVKPAVTARAAAFSLADVRLREGPFRQAQERDARYLLQLEPDRLMHNFRVNAGLQPRAPVYGGWESVEPWVAIRCHGHTLGHYLSACAFMFARPAIKDSSSARITSLPSCATVRRQAKATWSALSRWRRAAGRHLGREDFRRCSVVHNAQDISGSGTPTCTPTIGWRWTYSSSYRIGRSLTHATSRTNSSSGCSIRSTAG